jgi:hypothetical protein
MSKITIDRALIDQALEVLADNRDDVKRCESDAYMTQYYDKAISDLREALAQPQQEPVYVQLRYKDDEGYWSPWGTPLDPSLRNKKWAPEFEMRLLYDEPPARKPLTNARIDELAGDGIDYFDRRVFARAVEAAHGIKDKP